MVDESVSSEVQQPLQHDKNLDFFQCISHSKDIRMVQRTSTSELYLITYTFTLFIIVAITTRKLDRRHFTRHNANISYLAYPKCVCLFIKKLWCVSIVAEEFLMNRPLCSSSCLVPRLIIARFCVSENFRVLYESSTNIAALFIYAEDHFSRLRQCVTFERLHNGCASSDEFVDFNFFRTSRERHKRNILLARAKSLEIVDFRHIYLSLCRKRSFSACLLHTDMIQCLRPLDVSDPELSPITTKARMSPIVIYFIHTSIFSVYIVVIFVRRNVINQSRRRDTWRVSSSFVLPP